MSHIPGLPVRYPRLRKVFALPREGSVCDDRWAVCAAERRWVLCDGASEGWDGGGWASALSRSLARWGPDEAAVQRARRAYARRARPSVGRTAWLDDRAGDLGSWSTALVVEAGPHFGNLLVSAVGDSTLFVLDGFELAWTFPMRAGEPFGSTPELLASGDSSGGDPGFLRLPLSMGGLRRPRLALATDALAARLLSAPVDRSEIFRFLWNAPAEDFAHWTRRECETGRLGHDDLTLLWVG